MVGPVLKYSILVILASVLCGIAYQHMVYHEEIKKTAMLHKQMLSVPSDATLHVLSLGTKSIILQCIPLEYDRQRVNLEDVHINKLGYLVYGVTSSTDPLPLTGFSLYWEVKACVPIVTKLWDVPILETGLCTKEDRNMSYREHSHRYTYSLYVFHSWYYDSICRDIIKNEYSRGIHTRTIPNKPGTQAILHYGVLFDATRSKVAFIDLNKNEILSVLDNIDSSKPLWPMFGVFKKDVEMKLIVGKDIKISKKTTSLIIKALS